MSHYKEIIRQNNKEELQHLYDFQKSQGWSVIPKAEKEQILRRIRFLEGLLKIKGKPYNCI